MLTTGRSDRVKDVDERRTKRDFAIGPAPVLSYLVRRQRGSAAADAAFRGSPSIASSDASVNGYAPCSYVLGLVQLSPSNPSARRMRQIYQKSYGA